MKDFTASVLFIVLFATASCGFPNTTSVPPALSADSVSRASANWPDTTPEALETGHQLFVQKCNGCHGYPAVQTISETRWPSVMQKMGRKADLTAEQTTDVLHFVLAARAQL